MANKTKKIFSNVAATSTDTWDSPALPAGETWVIDEIGCGDINTGDHKSSTYLIRFGNGGGWEDIMTVSLTGATYVFPLREEVVGDGSKMLRIIRQNNSSVAKRCPVWIKAHSM